METSDRKSVTVVLSYDSMASDSSVSAKLEGHLTEVESEGNILIQQYGNVLEQPNTCTGLIKIKELKQALRCMINKQEVQEMSSKTVDIPRRWSDKYGLGRQFENVSGEVQIVIGMDNAKLHPRYVDKEDGLVLSRSVITQRMIISGKISQQTPTKRGEVSKDKSTVQRRTITSGDAETDVLLKHLSSVECPNSLKRCMRCQKCDQCKKSYLPDQDKNEKMTEILKKNVQYNDQEKCYEATYIYNEEIKNLPTYEKEVLRMQMNLERKLDSAQKTDQFNQQTEDFFKRKVLEWVPENELVGPSNNQFSFIPLTYTEREQSSTALRICGNSSFSSSHKPSLNEVMVPGPNVMTSLLGCILQFRVAHTVALGDISKMFHRVRTDKKTNNLRRVWIRDKGMGSNTKWRVARFTRMSFGDLLAPSFAVVILHMCIETFIINQSLKKRVVKATYMDDVQIPVISGENVSELIKETQEGLGKGGFPIKSWTKTGEKGPSPEIPLLRLFSRRRHN